MQGMLFAVSGWTRGLGLGDNRSSFRVPCACVLEAVSLSAANVNDGVVVIEALEEVLWNGVLQNSGLVTWLNHTDWLAQWTNLHGSRVRLKVGQAVHWTIDAQGEDATDVMVVMYFREG